MQTEDLGAIIGMVFGDGYLNVGERLAKGKYPYMRSELRIVHSITQLAYCEHKAERIRKSFGGMFKVAQFIHSPPSMSGKAYRMCGFTCSNPTFRDLRPLLYPDGKKTFTPKALDKLTPEGIAYWYMDDGSVHRNINKDGWVSSVDTIISTYCTETEAKCICDYFLRNHGVAFRIGYEKSKHSHIVRANTHESRLFAKLVQPFIIPTMLYKISHVADLDLHEHQPPVGVCSKCNTTIFSDNRRGLCVACYTRELTAARAYAKRVMI